MKSNQKGFSLIVTTIVVVIVGLLGALGWFVYSSQNSKSDKEQTGTSQTQTETLKEEKNTEFGFSYKYPDESDWETFFIKADSQMYTTGERVNNTGVNYISCGETCGSAFAFSVYAKGTSADPGSSWGEKQMNGNSYYKLSSKKDVTKNGVTGTRWEYTPGDSKSAKIVYYYFAKGNLSYVFTINSNGSIADKVDLTVSGEKIMETFRFTD